MDGRTNRKSPVGSAQAMHEQFQDVDKIHEPPLGCQLTTEEEKELWRGIMRSRTYNSWTGPDLTVAHTVVKQVSIIKVCEQRLEERILSGCDPCEPDTRTQEYATHLRTLRIEMLTHLRLLGLSRSPGKSAASLNNAETGRDVEDAIGDNVFDLMAIK